MLVTAPAIVCINDLKHGNMKKRLVVAIVMLCSVVSVVRDNKPHKYGFMGEYTEVLSFDAKEQTLSVISEHMKGTEKDKQRCDINTSFHILSFLATKIRISERKCKFICNFPNESIFDRRSKIVQTE